MATHSSILAWSIPQTEEPEGLQSMGSHESDMTECLSTFTSVHFATEFGSWCRGCGVRKGETKPDPVGLTGANPFCVLQDCL